LIKFSWNGTVDVVHHLGNKSIAGGEITLCVHVASSYVSFH